MNENREKPFNPDVTQLVQTNARGDGKPKFLRRARTGVAQCDRPPRHLGKAKSSELHLDRKGRVRAFTGLSMPVRVSQAGLFAQLAEFKNNELFKQITVNALTVMKAIATTRATKSSKGN